MKNKGPIFNIGSALKQRPMVETEATEAAR
jgi:hypothetical protein